MKFLILLVAGALADSHAKCWKVPVVTDGVAADSVAEGATGCHAVKDDATGIACTKDNCAIQTETNVWGESYACAAGTALVAGDNCAFCKDYLRCAVDTWTARTTAEAGTDGAGAGWTDPATCGDDLKWYTDNMQASCTAVASWGAANMPTCADPAVAADLVDATPVYGPDGTTCTKAIADKCMIRAQCDEFVTFVPAFVAPASDPAGGSADADAGSTTGSPAAMISAGIALIALLF